MTSPLRRLPAALAAAGLLLSAGAAGAQAPPPQQQQQGQHIDLHAVLHIRPDQEGAWRTYQQGMVPPPGIVSQLRASAQRMLTLTTPQRLDIIMQNMQVQQTVFQHQAEAIRRFYMALSPEQQHIFDQVTVPGRSAGH